MTFMPIQAEEFDAVFTLVKQGIYPYVEACFGWNDDLQRKRLINEYQRHWFHWVIMDNKPIGLGKV